MKKYLMFILLITFISCEDYVTNIDKPVEVVYDDNLNSAEQFEFLIEGVKIAFSHTHHQLCGLSDGLSDHFTSNPESYSINLIDIDNGEIEFDNGYASWGFNNLGRLRFYADDLVRRVNEIGVSVDDKNNNPQFYGYLFGGIARYYYATYYGLNPTEGGGVIDNGPFIQSSEMYTLAIEKFELALQSTDDAYEIKLVNSLMARTYLYSSDYENAAKFAAGGLTKGDKPFEALYTAAFGNFYYNQAGINEQRYLVDQRFMDYITADSMETGRIQLAELVSDSVTIGYYQLKYPDWASSIPHITWQENNLMMAELVIRGAGSGDALQLVNEVRSSHGIQDLSAVNLDIIYEERDKELFCTGSRLPDQRRFNKWHLAPDKWQYLPISQDERDINPNIN